MISVELTKRFRRKVREAGREDEVSTTLRLVQDGFGNPHAHAGISIRKLGEDMYECRTGLAWRLIFVAKKGVLTFDFAGNHDEVQNYLQRAKNQFYVP
jgi:mRNA-degrading endonuclease YafQ of YafQ-DinJ toxin-antitoxin module